MSTSNLLVLVCVIGVAYGLAIGHERQVGQRSLASCTSWYKKQIDPAEHLKKTLSPPCKIPATFPSKLLNGWSTDPSCDAKKQPNTCSYHVGAYGCYRHAFKSTGPGAQSCYDKDGVWISDPWKGAGTLDVETPLGSLFQQLRHVTADVTPYDDCCKDKSAPQPSTCNMYYEKRPPGQCQDVPAI